LALYGAATLDPAVMAGVAGLLFAVTPIAN